MTENPEEVVLPLEPELSPEEIKKRAERAAWWIRFYKADQQERYDMLFPKKEYRP